jgi:prepilin-type N-terminal cleavage/methylation domain-containing protein
MRRRRAFSLVEVVIAVAVVAVGTVTILALLPGIARRSTDSQDAQVALRLPDAVTYELRAQAVQRGFDGLAATVGVMSSGADEGLLLVAARDGSQVRLFNGAESPARDQHYLIEVRRFGAGDLAYSAGSAVLPLNVRVSWPYRQFTPEGLMPVTPVADRQTVSFNLGIGR